MGENSLGYLIRHYRTLKPLSRIEFAKEVGVSSTAVWQWETNKRKVRPSHLRKIAEVLSVDVTEFTKYLVNKEE